MSNDFEELCMKQKNFCYIGNWGKDSSSIGYTICDYNAQTGMIKPFGTAFSGLSVGAHCVDHKKMRLYTADEKMHYPGMRFGGGGEVHCFAIDPESGMLTQINSQPSYGALTSYVALDPLGEFLVATNHGSRNYVTRIEKDTDGKIIRKVLYDSSTVALYPLNWDGSIAEVCDVYCAEGEGPLAVQFASHLHSVVFAPDGSFCLVCDKGGDQIFTFRIDRENKKLIPAMDQPVTVMAGAAPRYSAFHPTKPFVYTNNEFNPVLHSFRYDKNGGIKLLEARSGYAKPCENGEKGMQSAICVSRDGKYLYSLVRTTDVVCVFEIDQDTGLLKNLQQFSPGAKNLRGGTLSPDGNYLLLAAIDSHEVLSCAIGKDGRIGEVVCRIEQPTPCCITFF